MVSKVSEVSRKRLERNHLSCTTDEYRRQQRVITHVGTNVINNGSFLNLLCKTPLFVVLIASQPGAVSAGTHDSPLAAQGALKNGDNQASGKPAQGIAEGGAQDGVGRNCGEVHASIQPP